MTRQGFTLLEVTLSVAIIVIIFGFSMPYSLRQVGTYNLEATRDTVVAFLNQSRTSAMANSSNSPKGVYFSGTTVTTYSGDSYATRDTNKDTVSSLPPGISISGTTEITFAQLTGTASEEYRSLAAALEKQPGTGLVY